MNATLDGRRRECPPERRAKIAAGVKLAHAENRFYKPDSRAKMSAAVQEAYARGVALGFKPGNVYGGGRRSPECIARAVASAQDACRGKHGFGRSARGRADHGSAKTWVIASPTGETFTFSNLLAWCRENEHRFGPDKQDQRGPLWYRAAMGIAGQNWKRPGGTWRGWRLVNVSDHRNHAIPAPRMAASTPASAGRVKLATRRCGQSGRLNI